MCQTKKNGATPKGNPAPLSTTTERHSTAHIERRKTCNQGTVAKHFHPAPGTLVYVLDGKSQSKSSGEWKTYQSGDYWFERTDWVHGGEEDAPDMGSDVCSDLLVIRVAEKGKDHTVFIK